MVASRADRSPIIVFKLCHIVFAKPLLTKAFLLSLRATRVRAGHANRALQQTRRSTSHQRLPHHFARGGHMHGHVGNAGNVIVVLRRKRWSSFILWRGVVRAQLLMRQNCSKQIPSTAPPSSREAQRLQLVSKNYGSASRVSERSLARL
jgi:hypothetical protein